MCLYVPPSPSSSFTRTVRLVKHLHIDLPNILTLFFLCMCLIVIIVLNIDLNCRYLSFDTRLNTLPVSTNAKRTENIYFSLLFSAYFLIFEYHFIVFLPCEIWMVHLDAHRIIKIPIIIMRMFHRKITNTTLYVCYKLIDSTYIAISCFCNYPFETIAIWISLIRLALCPDIHPNPGPAHSNDFTGGFLSFCNWNLNTLSKEDFIRITLLEAHNTEHNYDIISLCETSLNDEIQVPKMPGYKFHSCNHPDGNRSGGVGIFYKESLPLKIRDDLSFNESIVCELIFGHKHIFFTVLYRNPQGKANSEEFNSFLGNLEDLHENIKKQKPYAMFFTGDFNAHSETWYPEGDTNPEGVALDNLFSDLI